MTAAFDLHLHSYWSYDANSTVEFYFQQAVEHGVGTIALTEHHTMDSIEEVKKVASGYPSIRYVPAAELTVTASIGPVDLVCLGLPETATPEMEEMFEEYRQWQRDTGDALSAGLAAMGYHFDREERLKTLASYRPGYVIAKQGATHISGMVFRNELVRRGWCTDETQAEFRRRISEHAHSPRYPLAERVIPVVKKHGGLVIIAHPHNYFLRDDRRRMDQLREELQLDGIECAHTHVPQELTPIYRKYCLEHRLLSSAGSDCHSDPPHYHLGVSADARFGIHSGKPEWLAEIEERLPK